MFKRSKLIIVTAICAIAAALSASAAACKKKCEVHDFYVVNRIDPTCTAEGSEERKCSKCGAKEYVTIFRRDHFGTAVVSRREPTCKTDGSEQRVCDSCGTTYTTTLEKVEHDYRTSETVKPDCTLDGYEIQKCTICGDEQKTTSSALGHKYGEAEITVAPTCETEGESAVTCSRCGKQVKEPIKASGHAYDREHPLSVLKEPTCTQTGSATAKCSACGKTETYALEKLEHDSVEFGERIESTCTTMGKFKGRKCSMCETVLEIQTPMMMKPHSYVNGHCVMCDAKEKFALSFDTAGGNKIDTVSFDYDQPVVLPAPPRKNGYIFTGWKTMSGKEFTGEGKVLTASVKLVASYVEGSEISTAEELMAIADAPDGNYVLTADINLQATVWKPVEKFGGLLNGAGHRIFNVGLQCNSNTDSFAFIKENTGTVTDLEFTDVTFNYSYGYVANEYWNGIRNRSAVAVAVNSGTVKNVKVTSAIGNVNINVDCHGASAADVYVGGVVGENTKTGIIENCSSSADITYNYWIYKRNGNYENIDCKNTLCAGVVAGTNSGKLTGCEGTGKISISGSTRSSHSRVSVEARLYAGGVVGITGGECADSYGVADITVSANGSTDGNECTASVGGFAGYSEGKISGCRSTGEMTANCADLALMGGFTGHVGVSAADNCYTDATVNGLYRSEAGGFAGRIDGTVQNCYAAGDVTTNGATASKTGGFGGNVTNKGSVSKCISYGNVSASEGSVGYFAGLRSGVFYKCYYPSSAVRYVGGKLNLSAEDEGKNIMRTDAQKLIDENFLRSELLWNIAGWQVIVDDKPLLIWETEKGHAFESKVYEPTCDEDGFTFCYCSHCGRAYVKDYKQATGHDYKTVNTVAPTCTAEGYTLQRCDTCNNETRINPVERLAHTPKEGTVQTVTEATCLTDGAIRAICTQCSSQYAAKVAAKGSHTPLDEGRVTREAMCTRVGEREHICADCASAFTAEIPIIAHSWRDVGAEDAYCVTTDPDTHQEIYVEHDGHTAGKICDGCGEYTYKIIPAHVFGASYDIVTEPTCTQAGRGEYTCTLCHVKREKDIAAKGHKDADGDRFCDVCASFIFNDGTAQETFTRVATVEQLKAVGADLTGYYMLDADIDLTGVKWTPIGTENHPFMGIFFGNGHTVKGLSFTGADTQTKAVYGLFGYNVGTVAYVTVENLAATVANGNATVGGVVAVNSGRVINCKLTGDNNSIGVTLSKTVERSKVREQYLFTVTAGGIVGENTSSGSVKGCVVTGKLKAEFKSIAIIDSPSPSALLPIVGEWFKQLAYETSLNVQLTTAFGGIAGNNIGRLSECAVTGGVTVFAEATALLEQLRGSSCAHLDMYAGSLVGVNTGTAVSCTAVKAKYDVEGEYKYEDYVKPDIITGKTYSRETLVYNHARTEGGVDGLAGFSTGVLDVA